MSATIANVSLSRRNLLKAGAAAGGGLVLGIALPGRPARAKGPGFYPDAFIRITPDDTITLVMHKVEMGQGTYTSMPMLIAEELEVDLAQVRLEHAPPDDALYYEPFFGVQETGGSTSVRGAWVPLRRAGAAAREMLIRAAAETWGVAPFSCRAERGTVIHDETDRRLTYGELAERAGALPIPDDVPLKDPKAFKLIGTPAKRLEAPSKVDGSAVFGIDVRLPGMKYAAIAICPVFGGTLAGVDEKKAKAVAGVTQVVRLQDAVAIIATNTWSAKQGLLEAYIKWNEGPNAKLSTEDIVKALAGAAETEGAVARDDGDAGDAMASAAQTYQAVYQLPFLAHATMEPVNCTVHVQPDGCDLWLGTQVQTFTQAAAAKITGLPKEKVRVHNHLLGGGFGRRLEIDFVEKAVRIAQQVDGPVKVTWSREEDIQHDMYRPYYYHRIAAGVDERGMPVAWTHRIAGASIVGRVSTELFPKNLRVIRALGFRQLWAAVRGIDGDAVEGAVELPYKLPNIKVDYVREEPPGIPTAFWRGVGPSSNCFVVESFIDELAAAAKHDPVEYRRMLLAHSPRALAVLNLAARKAGWGTPLPERSGRGIALLHAFGSYLAQVADVTVAEDGQVRVTRVVCAVDCGIVVNPDTVRAQIESGVVFGLSAALWGRVTLRNGRVEQGNFNDYRVMRINETPEIDVHIVESTEPPGGIGEPGTSVVFPAVANAVYATTRKRIRSLPIVEHSSG